MIEYKFSAVVTVSRRKPGEAFIVGSFLLGVVVFITAGGGQLSWVLSLLVVFLMLVIAVLVYRGIPLESELSIARGYLFVNAKNQYVSPLAFSPYFNKLDSIEEEGGVVRVRAGWSQLSILFRDETQRKSFVSEVSGLLSAQGIRGEGK